MSEYFEKIKTVVVSVFPEIWTLKNLVRYVSKKHRFRTPFNSQHAKGSNTAAFSTTALWSYFAITLRNKKLEDVSLSDI